MENKKDQSSLDIATPAAPPDSETELSRRRFMQVVGVFTLTAGTASLLSCETPAAPNPETPENPKDASMGYILVDSRKCQGCLTCMIACSLAHEGCVNLSMARLQVTQNPFQPFPDDIAVHQCRQCLEAPCIDACPTGALTIDRDHGNVRVVDTSLCVGCGRCHKACIFEPERPAIAPDPLYGGRLRSRKCDLCQNASHHFDPKGGGINGIQICAAVCPLNAIEFTTIMPTPQNGGYDINLRDNSWGILGFATD